MPSPLRHALTTLALLATPLASANPACAPALDAVSYTHLTLPTIDRV